MSLEIVEQPNGAAIVDQPELTFYNDPPHRKKFNLTVRLNGGSRSKKTDLRVRLLYENGNEIKDSKEKVLIESLNNQRSIAGGSNISLQFGIAHVSFRHDKKKFKLVLECDGCLPVESNAILVKAKPPNPKKRKAKVLDDLMTQIGQVQRTKSQEAFSKVTSKYHGISVP
jgi:hypothetical protein